jgi:hypothetical protein
MAEQPNARRPFIRTRFTNQEDQCLLHLVAQYGTQNWRQISHLIRSRNPRQCRERYQNYLNPALRHNNWTADEDSLLEQKYREFGCKWNTIAKFFINRSDTALRNRWMVLNRRQTRLGNAECDLGLPVEEKNNKAVLPEEIGHFKVNEEEVAVGKNPSNPCNEAKL